MRCSILYLTMLMVVFAVKSAHSDMTSAHKQCRERGYLGACIIEGNKNMCEHLKCATTINGGKYDWVYTAPAAVGTECGNNRACSENRRCMPIRNNRTRLIFNCH